MMTRKSILLTALIVPVLFLILLAGCNSGTSTLTLVLTDAPAVDNFSHIYVDFGSVKVSQSSSLSESDDSAGWITIAENPGRIDLLTLTNGLTEELGTVSLESGKYNQIRLMVESVTLVVDGVEYTGSMNSDTVKLVKSFTLVDGIETTLVADFNASKSVQKTGAGQYRITPVIKLQQVDLSGAIAGSISGAADVLVTVSAFSDYQGDDTAESEAGTVADSQGNYKLGFLPEGTYDILVEAEGYEDILIADQAVTVGEVLTLDPVTLVPLSN